MQNRIEQLDSLIRTGRARDAIEIIRKIKLNEVAPADRLPLSSLAHRLQLPILAVQFLKNPIRQHREKVQKASPEEIMAYVRPLVRLGFHFEAENWIKTLNADKYPEVNDLMARISMAQWDYRKAIFYLKKYRNRIPKETYQFEISTINYSASLIDEERMDEAVPLLEKLLMDKSSNENRLLQGNARELLAQAHLKQGKWKEAESHLRVGGRLLGHSQARFKFLIDKWSFARDLYRHGPAQEMLQLQEELKIQATDLNFWEGVRDVDKIWALSTGDETLARHLYFGTLHEAYRKKLLNKISFQTGDRYLRAIGGQIDQESKTFSAETHLESGRLTFNLFQCLNHDFYQPLSMGYLFSRLYPGEFFDPDSSPRRLYRGVERLNEELKKSDSLLACQWAGGRVQLISEKPVAVIVGSSREVKSKEKVELQELRSLVGNRWFSRSEVCSHLNLKVRKAQTLLKSAGTLYQLEKAGAGPSTRYRFCG